MKEFDAKKHFLKFIRNLKTSDEQEEIILKRVAKITKVINLEYWEIHSESKNSTLVGSYGRGTAINFSDVDLFIKLPENQKQRFTTYLNNGQSALLQDIKSKLKEVYPTSQIKGDGQIVSIKFSDGIGFEILPAFPILGEDGYEFPDTHNKGSWKKTNPDRDQQLLTAKNKQYKGIVKKFAKMLRAWKNNNNVKISGITIDVLVYNFVDTWNIDSIESCEFDEMSRDFFKWLYNFTECQNVITSLDNSYNISLDESINSKANTAWNRAQKAIKEYANKSTAENEWIKIYGKKFPIYETQKGNETKNIVINSISNRKKRKPIGNAKDTEEFLEDKDWAISEHIKIVTINAELEMNGFRKGSIRNFLKIPIKTNSKINFFVSPHRNITWYWKIRNVGETANRKDNIRGQILKGTNQHTEPINFKGTHYVEAYGLSEKTVEYFGKIEVPLEDI